jgi:hypothetical protein
MTIHRRQPTLKKPWGPALLRTEFSGTTTTTLSFSNLGLDTQTRARMTQGFTRWAHGHSDCMELHDTPLTNASWPTAVAPGNKAGRRKGRR